MNMTQNRIERIVRITLGVCLVLALFTGAVVAESNDYTVGDVVLNYLYDGVDDVFEGAGIVLADNLTGWTNTVTGKSVSFTCDMIQGGYYIADSATSAEETELAGTYAKAIGLYNCIINVVYPTATIAGLVLNKDGMLIGSLIGGTANTDNIIYINATGSLVDADAMYGLGYINPDATIVQVSPGSEDYWSNDKVKGQDLGLWTIVPVFTKGNGFAALAPDYMYGKKATFTLVSADTTKKLTAAAEEVTLGGYVTITLTAPYGTYHVGVDKEGTIPEGQPFVSDQSEDYPEAGELGSHVNITVGTSGVQTFVVQSKTSNDLKVTLYEATEGAKVNDTKKEITIKVNAGAITAVAEKESVYIGDEFDVEGTNDLGKNVYFYIKGTNYALKIYPGECGSGKVWDATIDTAKLTSPDAGVYTIYVAKPTDYWYNSGLYEYTCSTDDFDNTSRFDAYTTLTVSLIQPFITANVENGVVVQGDKLEVTGTAEGTPSTVKLYVFGTNFFATDDASVLDDGTYSFSKKTVSVDSDVEDAWKMATGQYFLVVQHPMYDKVYNIGPMPPEDLTAAEAAAAGNYNIVLNESGSYQNGGSIIFNTLSRQSSKAAQALIDAIHSQNIDDMEAHLSFIISGPTSYVNAVPSQVTKGQALTISGTTTGHTNEIVAVELLSTAFAAVPKETVGSAAFATMTTRIGDDGVWSVSFDTSNLNAGEYTVSIAVGSLDPVTAKTTIVGGVTPTVTPTPVPTVSPTPNVPTTYTVGIKENSPYSYLNEDGGITGFDVECMRWIATEMGYSVEFKYVDWDNMATALSSGKCDILSSGLAINQNLTEYMDFTRSYWSLSTDAMSKAGKGYTIQNITAGELILGVVRDSTSDEKLELSLGSDVYSQMAEAGKIKYYDTEADILEGLQTNAVNVSIADSTFVKQQIAAFPGIYEVVGTIPETTEKLAAAVKKGNTQLLNQLNKGYARLQSTSTWDRLLKKYGLNGTATPAPADTSDFQLSAGWNFISVPKKLSSAHDTVAELFAGVDFANHALLSYNAETKSWEQLTGSSAISPLNAYWIYSASPVELQYEFDTTPAIPAVKKVYEGWNAVGVSAETPITAKIAFGNTDWYTYITWNAGNQVYNLPFVKGSSGNYADTNTVSLWSGGWLYVNAYGNYVGFTA